MKRGKIKILSLVILTIMLFSCQQNNGGNIMNNHTIFSKGDQGPKEYFTNTAWVKMLVLDEDKAFDTQVYNITFEPEARTYWHSHPGGQILLVTNGTGYYQEKGKPARQLKKGDVVAIPPDVNHWHGAAPGEEFIHIGMSTQVHLGPAEWFGPVTDEQYNAATVK